MGEHPKKCMGGVGIGVKMKLWFSLPYTIACMLLLNLNLLIEWMVVR